VTFTGGVYDFSEWDVSENVRLNFLAPSEIRIAGKLSVDQGSYLGPDPSSTGLNARDIVIYVNGINGSTGNLGGTPKAAKFGISTEIHANVYAPNGTLWLRQNGTFTGAFLAKWVDLGIGATASLLSQWTEGTGGSASAPMGGLARLAAPLRLPLLQTTDTPTATDSPTDTPTPTDTPSETPTPSDTSTEAPTPLDTETPTSTPTPTYTPTETPTNTPTPTATPTSAPISPALSAAEGWSVVIDFTYDPLYRLIAADYSTGEFFHYSYDAVGNRLTQDTLAGTNTYSYDVANRLVGVDGVPYRWDANGNLFDDGFSDYRYDHANRLEDFEQPAGEGELEFAFAYNGLGDRVAQDVPFGPTINYTLDLEAGLTQVLADGTNAYLYGVGRIGEEQPGGWQFHLGDALERERRLGATRGVMGCMVASR